MHIINEEHQQKWNKLYVVHICSYNLEKHSEFSIPVRIFLSDAAVEMYKLTLYHLKPGVM